MTYGITPQGLNTKSFTVLKQELLELWGASFGEIDTRQDGAFGQIADSVSFAHSEFWQIIQDIYLNMNPNTATGANLARLLALQGMTPRDASSASVDCICGGTVGTTIPAGSEVSHNPSGYNFSLNEDIVLSTGFLNRLEFKISDTPIDGGTVGFNITSHIKTNLPIHVTVDVANGLGTAEELAKALVTELWNNSVEGDISEAVVSEDDPTTVVITTFSPFRTIAVSVAYQGTFAKVWRNGHFTSPTAGVFISAPHTVTNIRTGVTGWTDVDNLISGSTGSDAENDDDIRRRLIRYHQYGSTGSRLAIEAKMWQDVQNLTNIRISENNTANVDNYGRPPHSMHCIVDGGDDQDIANIIAQNIPAGISSFGAVSKDVTVSWQAEPFVVNFDRVGLLFGHIKVIVEELNEEEVLPSNAEQLIREAVFSEVIKVTVLGADIITQKYVGAVYASVNGLGKISIQASVTGRPETDPSVKVGNSWSYDVETYSSGYEDEKVIVAPYDKVEWRDGYERITIEGLTNG